MNKEDKCIVMGCRNKKFNKINFCKNCYTYFISGKTNNCQASKNDIKNLEYMDNLTLIDNEIKRINVVNGKQIEMNYEEKEIT